ncbi:MAG TPA: high-potential iron-sulfur protein [Rhodanobacteraceae bacterium]
MTEEAPTSRRRFLKLAGGAAAAVALLAALPRRAMAALPHLTQANNATAKALHYVDDNTKAGPPHKAGEDCAHCVHFQGKAGQTWGPCAIFPGFDVNHLGWCDGFQAK